MNKAILINAGIAVAGLAIGYTVGTLHLRKRLDDEYSKLANDSINEMREHYRLLRKEGPYGTPAKARETFQQVPDGFIPDETFEENLEEPVEELFEIASKAELVELLEKSGYTIEGNRAIPPATSIPEGEKVNVFADSKIYDSSGKAWDLAEEEKEAKSSRNPDEPYQITTAEFHEEFDNFEKITVTYYEYDNIIADENHEIVDDSLIGLDNINKFATLAEDKNFIYVRNEKEKVDYEIIFSESSWAETSLGVVAEEDEKPSKFRNVGDHE